MSARRRACRVGLLLALTAGCGSGGNSAGTGGLTGTDASKDASKDASFAVCAGTPAVPFTAGLSVLSAFGAYRVTFSICIPAD
ncbi:MAG TPA: hypothetical protein VLT58_00195 [Polyangia bacterium]|nr:hypothetical protein [Polyangia bacterium]